MFENNELTRNRNIQRYNGVEHAERRTCSNSSYKQVQMVPGETPHCWWEQNPQLVTYVIICLFIVYITYKKEYVIVLHTSL